MLRLFVGLELPQTVLSGLHSLCSGLSDCRWVASHNMHITTLFVGEVDELKAEDLHQYLSEIRFEPFELHLSEIGTFDSKNKARVLWTGVKGDVSALNDLQHKTASCAALAGVDAQRRKYKPHVTLAWLHNVPVERLGAYIEHNNDYKSEPFTVDHFSLYRSHLTKHGGEYEVIERYSAS